MKNEKEIVLLSIQKLNYEILVPLTNIRLSPLLLI